MRKMTKLNKSFCLNVDNDSSEAKASKKKMEKNLLKINWTFNVIFFWDFFFSPLFLSFPDTTQMEKKTRISRDEKENVRIFN
jgi:hypothetical protein